MWLFVLLLLLGSSDLASEPAPEASTQTTASFKELSDYALSYRDGAEGGDARSQYNLGAAYRWGVGVGQNLGEAVRWISKSAEQGYAPAQRVMSTLYATGEGVKQNNVEAYRWCRLAARQGDPLAEEALPGLKAKLTTPELMSLGQ